jgi:hypothetical protein
MSKSLFSSKKPNLFIFSILRIIIAVRDKSETRLAKKIVPPFVLFGEQAGVGSGEQGPPERKQKVGPNFFARASND